MTTTTHHHPLVLLTKNLLRRWRSAYNFSRRFYFFMLALDYGMRVKLFGMQFLGIVNNQLYLIGSLAIIPFVNYLANPEKTLQNRYIASLYEYVTQYTSFNFTIVLGIISIAALFVARAASLIGTYWTARMNQQLNLYYTNKLFSYYIRRNIGEMADMTTAEIMMNIKARLPQVLGGFVNPVFSLIDTVVFLTTGIIIIALFSPPIFVLLMLPIALLLLGAITLVRNTLTSLARVMDKGQAKTHEQVLETVGAREDIQILGKESVFIRAHAQTNYEVQDANLKISMIGALFAPITEFLIYTMMVLSVTVLTLTSDTLDLSAFTVFILVLYRIMPRFNQLFSIYSVMRTGVISYDAVADSLLPALAQKMSYEDHIRRPLPIRNNIQLRHISHQYKKKHVRQQPDPALNDINMRIAKGMKVGICGESGCGKTTLLRILTGFIKPSMGEILIDDKPLNSEARMRKWRDGLGYVSQNIVLLQNSIAANIALGDDEASINMGRLQKTLYLAAADEFVGALEHGVRASLQEAGKSLSGGQRQRIVIARALYRRPKVLIFDEATAALDKKTESTILTRLWQELVNETIIFVTHRIESISNCDILFFFDKGHLVAQGSYNQLLKNAQFRQLLGRLRKEDKENLSPQSLN